MTALMKAQQLKTDQELKCQEVCAAVVKPSVLVNPSQVLEVEVHKEWMPRIVNVCGNVRESDKVQLIDISSDENAAKVPEVIDLTNSSSPLTAKSIDAENLLNSENPCGPENGGAAESGENAFDKEPEVIDLTVKKEGESSGEGASYQPGDIIDLTADGAAGASASANFADDAPTEVFSPRSPSVDSDDFLPDLYQNQLMDPGVAYQYDKIYFGNVNFSYTVKYDITDGELFLSG